MSTKSLTQRIKITKKGNVLRRAMGLGHNKAQKRAVQIKRRQKYRGLDLKKKNVIRYLNR